jgi:predicted nucleic acid-binding protein
MNIVSDAGPLLSFARAHRLHLLRRVTGTLIIPPAVYEEIVVYGAGKPGSAIVQAASWIIREPVRDRVFVTQLPTRLHLGEREAIALAKERSAFLLVDESEARREARRQGVTILGSLRVLKEAKDRGIITQVKPTLDELIASGIYISDSLYRAFLHDMAEG